MSGKTHKASLAGVVAFFNSVESAFRSRPYLTVFTATLLYYTLYHYQVFLNLNSVLSSSIDDSLKNYYTYVYHIRHSPTWLEFTGFNYPFGEHLVYTDCQPLLTLLLRPFAFSHDYAIGILHGLIFLSFLICPLFYLYLFRKLDLPYWSAFAVSIAITILSPQYFRIFAGHYALAYTCIIPAAMCLMYTLITRPQPKFVMRLFLFNSLAFLIHPYYGLGLSLFSAFCLGLYWLIFARKNLRIWFQLLITGPLPIGLFMAFMAFTDTHKGRSSEPYGNSDFISDISSFLVPVYGPFNGILTRLVGHGPQHFEGCAYLGAGFVLVLAVGLVLLPFFIRKLKVNQALVCMLFTALVFLLFSFGLQYSVQEKFGLKINALNQFRAMGRFSWFLYFILPVALFYFWSLLSRSSRLVLKVVSFVYLCFNLYEGHAYLGMYDGVMWTDRNIFNSQALKADEKAILDRIRSEKAAAILPLPLFYLGSEVYDRSTFTQQLFLSAFYSSHSGLPIQSSCMSRTSVTETEAGIDLINSYKRHKTAASLLKPGPLLVMKCPEALLLDEERVWSVSRRFARNDSVEFAFVDQKRLSQPILHTTPLVFKGSTVFPADTNQVWYIQHAKRKPFEAANQLAYEQVAVLKADHVLPGKYVLSLHYYTSRQTYHEMSNMLVLAKRKDSLYAWQDIFPLKLFSGFGKGFAILEQPVELESGYDYEVFIHGGEDLTYRVSDFMLRPIHRDVLIIRPGGDSTYNNYPVK